MAKRKSAAVTRTRVGKRLGWEVLSDSIEGSGRSMHAIALEAGVDASLLSKYRRNMVPVGEANSVKLAKVLGVPSPALVHGDEWRKITGVAA